MEELGSLKVEERFQELWDLQPEIPDKMVKIIDAIYCRLILKEEKRKNHSKILNSKIKQKMNKITRETKNKINDIKCL